MTRLVQPWVLGVFLLPFACAPRHGPDANSAAAADDATLGTQTTGGALSSTALVSYQAGVTAFEQGDLQGARVQLEAAVQSDAKGCAAHSALGAVRERLGLPGAALQSYQAALNRCPGYEPALLWQAHLLLAMKRAEEAERSLQAARARFPENAAVLTALAEVRSQAGRSAEAQAFAQEALRKNPDYRPAMLLLARDHFRARRWELALFTLTAILDGYGVENPPRDKNNGEAHLLRALILKEQGRRRAAIDEFRRAVLARPDLLEARLNLAVLMLEAGNAEEAAPVLELGLRYEPSNVLLHLCLGDAYRLLGRADEAIKQLEWVTLADPSLGQAHYDLGLLYLFSPQGTSLSPLGAVSRAIDHFEQYARRQARARSGSGDDVNELLTRARNKKAVLEAMNTQPAVAPAAPAAPAGSSPVPSSMVPPATVPPATVPSSATAASGNRVQ
jgi:tetratricopeptide (TPR) repeat protein